VFGVSDLLSPLTELVGVRPAVDAARRAVDAALAHRALRRSGGPVAAEMGLRSAVASAALEGHEYDVEDVRAGTVTDPVVQGALRVTAALDALAPRWTSAPRQVLARLHLLVAAGAVDDAELGRPVDDPVVAARLDALCEVVAARGAEVPVLVRAAVVHGELLSLAPFAGPNGVLARAAARLTLIGGGMDPRGLLAAEPAHLARAPEYVGSANAFATGTPDGVRSWLRHCAGAVEAAAADLTAACNRL
jgi:hypothetical protein